MKFELKIVELVPAQHFFSKLTLAPADSRCRSKVIKQIGEALQSAGTDEEEILEKYAKKDAKGEALHNDKGSYVPDHTMDAARKRELNDLYGEVVTIGGGLYAKSIDKIPGILGKITDKLSGDDAAIYDALMDQFEKEVTTNDPSDVSGTGAIAD